MQPDIAFGPWLRERRRAAGLTQQELAERVGCAPVTLKKIEAGERRPSRQVAERILAMLGVSDGERSALVRLARLPSPAAAPAAPAADLAGQRLRGYELHEQIGRGGFGVVYRASQPAVGREVAVKAVLPQHADSPEFVRRFEAEARTVARLEHPHIVPLYDYWREPGGAFLVMRYLRGGSLRERMAGGPLADADARRAVGQLCAALGAAHRAGVIHRDLKPANVLLDAEGNAYLADFGVARDMGGEPLDEPGAIVGSPAYLAPEQIRVDPISPRTDIYSLGLLIYELLCGERAFGDGPPADLIRRQLSAPLPALSARRPDLPAALDTVLARACAKEPGQRFASPGELLAALSGAGWQAQAGLAPGLAPAALSAADAPTEEIAGAALAAENPYKGLRAFDEADAADFFGREALVAELLGRMGEEGPGARLLAVVGPSGSGKSSLVRAGLLPALRAGGLPGSEGWFVAELLPGGDPLAALADALRGVALAPPGDLRAALAADAGGLLRAAGGLLPPDGETELLLVIDQFEELFTLVDDEAARAHILASLHAAAADPASRLRLLITLRADFYDRPLLYPGFGDLVRLRTAAITPMGDDELRRAVAGPAARAGLRLEPELLEALVADVRARPGALPLLQYALTELYERRRGDSLTLRGYREIGAVAGALARRADEIYALLPEARQEPARRLFLRLISLGEGSEDTRRRVRVSELGDPDEVARMPIEVYGRYRLLTFDRDPASREPTVEVAHEALIRAWGRLRGWIDDSRDELRLQRRLSLAAAEWAAAGRDPSFLAGGSRLDQLAGLRHADIALSPAEAAYLAESLAEHERRAQEDDLRRRRELEGAAQARSAARLRRLALALMAAVVVAAGMAGLTWWQRNEAVGQSQARATAVAQAQVERDGALQSRATAVAAEAEVAALARAGESLAALASAPDRALLLALAAQPPAGVSEQPLAAQALFQSFADASIRLRLGGHAGPVRALAWSPDGRSLVSGDDDGALVVSDALTGQELARLPGHAGPVRALAWSPDGRTIASAGADGVARLWDAATGAPGPTLAGHAGAVSAVAWRHDGLRLLTAGYDGTLRTWDAASGAQLAEIAGHDGLARAAAWSPDGRRIASGGDDGAVRIWDAESGAALATLSGHRGLVSSVAWSPDGGRVASGSADASARIWDAASGAELVTMGDNVSWVWSVAWSPDGRQLATASFDGAARVWNAGGGRPLRVLRGHAARVWAVAWRPDGRQLATSSDDATLRVWDATTGRAHIAPPQVGPAVTSDSWSADGARELLGYADGGVLVFDVAAGTSRGVARLGAPVGLVAWSPDESSILAAGEDGSLAICAADGACRAQPAGGPILVQAAWSPDGRQIVAVNASGDALLLDPSGAPAGQLPGQASFFRFAAWSPDGRQLATGHDDGSLRIWGADADAPPRALAGHAGRVWKIVWSPDGGRLLTASDDGTAGIWDVASGAQLQRLSGHSGAVLNVAWSPDGARALSGGDDGIARIWDAASGRLLRALSGQASLINIVRWPRPDEALVGAPDGSAERWLVGEAAIRADVARRACALFSAEELRAAMPAWAGCDAELAGAAGLLRDFDVRWLVP